MGKANIKIGWRIREFIIPAEKSFPFKKDEELKIYGIRSVPGLIHQNAINIEWGGTNTGYQNLLYGSPEWFYRNEKPGILPWEINHEEKIQELAAYAAECMLKSKGKTTRKYKLENGFKTETSEWCELEENGIKIFRTTLEQILQGEILERLRETPFNTSDSDFRTWIYYNENNKWKSNIIENPNQPK